MRVDLTSELQALVESKLREGGYASAEEVVGRALRLLAQYDRKLVELQREIDKGIEDIEAGRVEYGSFSEMIAEFEGELQPKR